MKIGVIGSGRIGGLLGRLWSDAGHEVMFSSRHPDRLAGLVESAGAPATTGTPDQAARFGEVVFIAIPLKDLPALGRDLGPALQGKCVLEAGNPYPQRDGEIATRVIQSGRGTGPWVAEWLPGARVVRAFNTVWDKTLASEAHRPAPQVGIPLASNDAQALEVASTLVRDAGFDPVIVGGLDRSKEFDVGTTVYDTGMSGPELRRALGLKEAAA